MAKSYNFLEGNQTDINRRLLRKIEALEEEIGSDDKATTIKGRIKALEDA